MSILPRFLPVATGLNWLLLAAVLLSCGLLAGFGPSSLPAAAGSLGFAALFVLFGFGSVRDRLAGLRYRTWLSFHSARFLVAWMLFQGLRAAAGMPLLRVALAGEIAVAAWAAALRMFARRLESRRGWLLAWNEIGLASLSFLACTAAWSAHHDPTRLRVGCAFGLLATVLLPAAAASHLAQSLRLLRDR